MANAAMGDIEQAISDFSEAIRIDPECLHGWQNRSIAYNANGNIDEAQADLKRAREMGYAGPGTAGGWFLSLLLWVLDNINRSFFTEREEVWVFMDSHPLLLTISSESGLAMFL